ncbi:MAG: hypothetical protein ABW157_21265 [Candidatus Thiodiazotropha sp. LLP2]
MPIQRLVFLLIASWFLICSSACESSSCNVEQLKKTLEREIIVNKAQEFSDIEENSMKRISLNPDVPQKPFGFRHEKWLAFKKKLQHGDCLIHFTTPEEAWKRLAGLEGYAIIRGNEVIAFFVLKVS